MDRFLAKAATGLTWPITCLVIAVLLAVTVFISADLYHRSEMLTAKLQADLLTAAVKQSGLSQELTGSRSDLASLRNSDPLIVNESLAARIRTIEESFTPAGQVYENLIDLKTRSKNTADLDRLFAQALSSLGLRNYASAQTALASLSAQIRTENDRLAALALASTTPNIPTDNRPPASGYRRQIVQTAAGNFAVSIITIDLGSARAIVDTASDSDCGNNCPVLPLASFAQRSGAFAGINGTFFCPTAYPSCAGKTNSFDLLLMNKNKKYFNSQNNVYSTNPAVAFYGTTARFLSRASDWGRDTGVDAVISNFPLLLQDGHIVFGGSGDPKFTSTSPRSFVGSIGNTVYLGVISGANMDQAAAVLSTLGISNALNLDDGGSSALWFSGSYVFGPGRDLPNALLFVRK